jgi:WD40 repeat protein
LTASTDGHVLIWDTNDMQVVLDSVPYLDDEEEPSIIQAMEVSQLQPQTVAMSSLASSTVKLMDLRSGATSHSLDGLDQKGGINCVKWSPSSPHVIASGGIDQTIRLFDIRKSGRRAQLSQLDQDALPDCETASAYQPHFAHLKVNKQRAAFAHDSSVVCLAWSSCGHFLLSCDDVHFKVWDMRHSNAVPVSKTHMKSKSQKHKVLLVSHNDRLVWYAHGCELLGMSMQKPGGGGTLVAQQQQRLQGHIGSLMAAVAVESTMSIITSGADSMILVWRFFKSPR